VSRVRSAIRFLVFAAAVLLPSAALAQVVDADLNGDGVHDRVDPGLQPTDIVVRLSTGRHQWRLHADSPIIRFAAVDFNRDGNVDLVATTSSPDGLAVWINIGDGRFSRRLTGHRPRAQFEDRGAGTSRSRRHPEPNENGDDVASRPLLLAANTHVPHAFSYVRRVRDIRVVHVRFQSRLLVPRGPPTSQLF
jgi:hypothetical protein